MNWILFGFIVAVLLVALFLICIVVDGARRVVGVPPCDPEHRRSRRER